MTLPHGAVGWSAVCYCSIKLIYIFYDCSGFKTYLLMRGLGSNVSSLVLPRGSFVGFLLLQYSVECTVESLSCFIFFMS